MPGLLLPAMAALSQQESRWILWAFPPRIPGAAVLAAAGIHPGRLLVMRPRRCRDPLPVLESALRAGNCSMVLAWSPAMDGRSLSRLRRAAEEGNTLGVLLTTGETDRPCGVPPPVWPVPERRIQGGQRPPFRTRRPAGVRQLALAF